MAISVVPAITTTAIRPLPSSSSEKCSKLSHFSSLHFPSELRNFQRQYANSKLQHRTLALVASKKQTFSSFDHVLEKSDKPVLVDFYAAWCGPCQFMVPVLEQVSASMKNKILIVKIDTEKYPTIANKYEIQALPTFILFKDGKPIDRFEGAMPADQLIERVGASLQFKK